MDKPAKDGRHHGHIENTTGIHGEAALSSTQGKVERRFGALLEAVPDATIIIRPDGIIDLANANAERMFGYGRHQLLGQSVDILMPERLRASHMAHRARFAQHPVARPMGSRPLDLLGMHADGSEFPVEISLSPLAIDGEEMVVAAIRDMTVRQRAEDRLRELSAALEQRVAERTAALEQANSDFRATFEQAAVGIAHMALDGRWLRVNQALCDIVGYTRQKLLALTFQDITHPDDLDTEFALTASTLHGDISSYTLEKRCRHKNGHMVWINLNVSLVRDNQGAPSYFIAVAKDIDDRKRADAQLKESEEALRASEHQLRMIIEANPIGTVKRNTKGHILEANAAYLRMVGRNREDLLSGRIRWDQMTPPEYLACDRKAMLEAQQKGVSALYEKEYVRPDGERVPVLFAFATIGSGQDLVTFTLDISERKRAEECIRQAALHDPLTGLPNRALLFEYAKQMFARATRARRHSAVVFIDLDRFKPINDNHGHEVGDEALKEVARRLTACMRAGDVVFRLGGDEFLVLLPDIADDANAGDVARHLSHSMSRPFHINELELSLSLSIGISIFPRDGDDINTLMNNADAAMYQAKQMGRNNFQFYSRELAARSHQQSIIEEQLKTALSHGEFRLYYQPVVGMQKADLIGVEALLRWPHDDVGPDRFVPIAEATGLIGRLGAWVIAEACRQHNAWRDHGLPAIPIAVNVSAVQFRQKDFAEQFTQAMRDGRVDTAALQLELTETALMENIDHAIEVLAQLKSMGVKIALDDFGTGYSSLSYLSRLPIDKIKVDKSFVKHIENDMASRAVTEAIIALGRTLRLEIVAEGIESDKAMRYLRLHGCDQAQGFHVCAPVAADGFESWYRRQYRARLH